MINLARYKNDLINYYRDEDDNNFEKREKRRETLNKHYDDNFLARIIDDTYDFLHDLLNNESIKNGYYYLPLEEDTIFYISLGLSGGYSSDYIYVTPGNRLVSKYIVKKELGQNFYFEMDEKESTTDSQTNIEYYLYMRNFPLEIKQIKEKLFGKTLVKRSNNDRWFTRKWIKY